MPTISLDSPAAAAAAGDPAGAAQGANALPADGGAAFAQRLALAQSALPQGQNLAAGALPLQALALGPTMELVTPAADGPDSEALAEFAKAQGLDEEVVAWLFGDPAALAQGQALAGVPPGAVPGGAMPAGATLSDGATSNSALTQVSLMATLAAGAGTPGTPGTPAPATGAAQAAAVLAGAATGLPAWLQQAGAATPATAPAADAGAAPDAAAPAAMQLQSFAAALAAAATPSGRSAQAAAAPQAPTGAQAGAEVLALEIEVEPGLESLWEPDAGAAAPAPGSDAASAGAGGDAGAQSLPDEPAATTTLAQRAQGYQALAQRLGEAVAQRVMAQIEKGHWQVRLMLRPEKLGEVEIDLKMRAGQVDAAFQASNPVTRDLLNEGLPRLREVLSQAGMEIADLNVGTGKGQHAGGNPTPRQSPGPAAPGAPAEAQAPDTAALAAAPAARRTTASGLDVLV
ncbi:flagellar hook-length control protein FliK [Ramlibacter sp. MAHUQ-53]|uniref:flagellar hook-length control protein FliK n=1 Tax=unclassified Ramlibacter TaxID=2617605 RepID=UPI0036367293